MSADGGFLSRWAKRKAEAAKSQLPNPDAEENVGASAETSEILPADDLALFDISKLPSIDSLTAESDLSMFMQFGVPEGLRNQALRRMWVTDTSIRDYVGLSDYAWDFHTPGALPGHGELEAGTDMARLVRQFTNDLFDSEKEPPPQDVLIGTDTAALLDNSCVSSGQENPERPALTYEDDHAVSEKDRPEKMPAIPKRRHGGAAPR